jgi:hypothetical protein
MDTFSKEFTAECSSHHLVENLWTSFNTGCLQALDANVPSKMTTQRYSQPWITQNFKRLSRRKQPSLLAKYFRSTPLPTKVPEEWKAANITPLARSPDVGEQVDCILLDFSKAFDRVPHNRLLMKLHYYGVRGHLHDWIASFLLERSQQVVLDCQTSSASTVSSGVPMAPSFAPCYFYSLSITYHHQSDPPPDYLQTTVSCTEESDHQRTTSSYRRTSTTCNNGKIDGLWLSILTSVRCSE